MTIIGIDLGTTFSAVSIVRDGQPVMLPVGNDNTMPSVVGLSPENRWMVGRPALNQWVLHPEQTIRSIKRKMGSPEGVTLGGQLYTPSQISAIILQALKHSAEQHLQQELSQAVITVPAYFSDVQRQATHEAGTIAGLEVMRIINEPTAAALAYGLQESSDEIALVYDLGGGTFDVSLVELSGGVVDVRASHGNTQLGGDDFDQRLAQWLQEQFESQHGLDLRGNHQALARIQRAAEQAKRQLSTEPYVWVQEEYLAQKQGEALHMEIEVSRPQFISLIHDLLAQTLTSVERVLEDGEVEHPDHVMLVGGSTYIPAIWEMVAEETGVTPRQDVNPSEAVALGAGIQGAIIAGDSIDAILVDITPYSLGISVAEVSLAGHVIPDRFKRLIHRNATIPTTHEEVFTTLYPGQDAVKIEVYQGESPVAPENTLLGEFLFENLEPATPGELATFTVRFDIDVNGMLKVETVDRGSKRKDSITVETTHQRLSHAQIQSAREALPTIAAQPVLPEEVVQEMDALLGRARVVMENLDDDDRTVLGAQVNVVYDAWEDADVDALREALDELTDMLFDLEA